MAHRKLPFFFALSLPLVLSISFSHFCLSHLLFYFFFLANPGDKYRTICKWFGKCRILTRSSKQNANGYVLISNMFYLLSIQYKRVFFLTMKIKLYWLKLWHSNLIIYLEQCKQMTFLQRNVMLFDMKFRHFFFHILKIAISKTELFDALECLRWSKIKR